MKKSILKIVAVGFAALSFVACSNNKLKDQVEIVKIGKFEPVELSSGTMRMPKELTSGLADVDFTVFLNPKNGCSELRYKYNMSKFKLLFDREGREKVCLAAETYLKDYEAKALDRNRTKPSDMYGVIRSRIEWGPFQYSANADPRVTFSYVFVGKSPYFCIRIPMTESSETKGDLRVKFPGTKLYFTRAQLKDLVEGMKEENFRRVAAENTTVSSSKADDYDGGYEEADTPKVEADDYVEN